MSSVYVEEHSQSNVWEQNARLFVDRQNYERGASTENFQDYSQPVQEMSDEHCPSALEAWDEVIVMLLYSYSLNVFFNPVQSWRKPVISNANSKFRFLSS
jgi:hypothetical protein